MSWELIPIGKIEHMYEQGHALESVEFVLDQVKVNKGGLSWLDLVFFWNICL